MSTVKRSYESSLRKEKSEQTKRNIVVAAKRLFAAKGYEGTTIEQIAKRAKIATPTVYFFFKSKEGVLNELIHQSLFGSEYESLLERCRALSDPIAALKMAAPIARAVYDAARSEMSFILGIYALSPEIGKVVSRLEQKRYEHQEPTIRLLEFHNLLPDHLDVTRARDLLWLLTCRENYRLLVIERGWSSEEYEAWLAGALVQFLVRS
jgi:AcrR family transcriptional regulator